MNYKKLIKDNIYGYSTKLRKLIVLTHAVPESYSTETCQPQNDSITALME